MFKKLQPQTLVIILTTIAAFLHFYNLNWGAPYYFHPDERNIASAVSQLNFPIQMNPHFFAYGGFPIYAIYFTGVLFNLLINFATFTLSGGMYHLVRPGVEGLNAQLSSPFTVSFSQAIIVSRIFSSLFATLLIPLLYFIGKKIKDEKTGLLAAFFATTSVGLIQFSHFGTFEVWLTFFSVLLFLLCLNIIEKKTDNLLFGIGMTLGVLFATKISHLAILPLPILALALFHVSHHKKLRTLVTSMPDILFVLLLAFAVFVFANPFVFSDYTSFASSMKYESEVALGTLKVFYTGAFLSTIPVLYQFNHIYPFLLNPLLTILFIPSFLYILFKAVKTKNPSYLFLISFHLLLFLSQVFLYVKWTRYMVPTLPFVYLVIAIALPDVIARSTATKQSRMRLPRSFQSLAMTVLILVNVVFAASYFITAFVEPDTRITAREFAQNTIPSDAPILTEAYDMGVTAFNDSHHNITHFNFYDLDNNSLEYNNETLQEKLTNSQYLVLPSQRVLKTRLNDSKNFPKGHAFYRALTQGELNFQKIYETPCSIFCQIAYMGNPVFTLEETVNVFDRPTVYIYKNSRE